ncbi:uncharacterized protein JCM10292_005625 [Rhodotorula paludigena]|uniref:uncharacterized protein n=1 Tax=Rhodotorula paludigena TaxID=86838 RepID=UPI0031808934
MTDFSAYSRGAETSGSTRGIGDAFAYPAQGAGGAAERLPGQLGALSLAHDSGPAAPSAPSLAPRLASSTAGASSASTGYAGAMSTRAGSAPGYSAANRPRPQLSPVLTGASAFTAPLATPASAALPRSAPPRQDPASLHQGTAPPASAPAARLPRKASLPSLSRSATADSDSTFSSAPPIPPLPASASFSSNRFAPSSTQSSFAAAPSSSARESAGGEPVFDGAALAAGAQAIGQNGGLAPSPSTLAPAGALPTRSASAIRRGNPLEDLIHTETAYVEDLGLIIKRVAAAWSRSNFPPPALDAMFRAIEAVYRINKTLLAKLLEIGPNPSSPKALGDLLMRWIPDLEPAYTRYAQTLARGYDAFAPVQSNPKLASVLAALPYPSTLPSPSSSPAESSAVTLDTLFELPRQRVAYYQRLYAKLLRSTQEGRSDHALLVAANDKLAYLERLCDEGARRSILEPSAAAPAEAPRRAAPPRLNVDVAAAVGGPVETLQAQAVQPRSSGESTRNESPTSSYRSSGATNTSTANTSATNGGPLGGTGKEGAAVRVDDLERRLDTSRTLDIFTMQPRKCKLQMQPPNLPFSRQLRKAGDVAVSFVPSSDSSQRDVRHPRAMLILLTDLFLICQRISPSEAYHANQPGADLWLLYPPLAGKHLRVRDGQASGELEVTIMNKERLTLRPEGGEEQVREWRVALDEAIRFGATQGSRVRQDSSMSAASSSGQGGRSPISPTYRASPLSPSFGAGVQQQQPATVVPSPRSTSNYSPVPPSPLPGPSSNGYGSSLGVGLPSSQSQPLGLHAADPARRAFSGPSAGGAPSVPRPERNASIANRGGDGAASFGNGPLVQSPTSASFGYASSSRGPSPYPASPQPSSAEYGAPSGSAYGSGRQSPYGMGSGPGSMHDFAPSPHGPPGPGGHYPTYPLPPTSPYASSLPDHQFPHPPQHQQYPQRGGSVRPDSRQSNGSYSSAFSGRTDGSYRYPDAPPPLPKELSYNGVDISRRGGPLYPTSLAGGGTPGPGSVLSASGRSGLLSPGGSIHRSRSAEGLRGPAASYRMPSQALLEDRSSSAPGSSRSGSAPGVLAQDVSPPTSPVEARVPDKTSIVAQMRCKIFLQQHHAQWKSLGTAKLKLYHSMPSGTKQLVVDSDKGGGKTVISTIVLTDGVERVGKTGVAIELSDQGDRTGIVYMLQMKTEQSATGLFEQLLLGSDRMRR